MTCQSCLTDATQLTTVRRVYVEQGWESDDERVTVLDDTEKWCDTCLDHYPHQLVGR